MELDQKTPESSAEGHKNLEGNQEALPESASNKEGSANQFLNPKVLESSGPLDKRYILLGLIAGLLLVGAVFAFSVFKKREVSFIPAGLKVSSSLEQSTKTKNVINPLTGVMYTEEEAAAWKNVRPLGVMINNHPDARPQAGLTDAELTYEVVAEGGITRFLAFYQSVLPDKVGPIRSAREYYLVLAKETGDAMYMHHGFSPQALIAIENWPVRSLQRGNAPTWRENPRNVAVEHTLYANAKELVKRGLELGWEGVSDKFYIWQFKDQPGLYAQMPEAHKISYDFWYKGDFSVMWEYDKTTNTYKRYMGFDSSGKEVPHKDEVTQKQIEVSNVIIQFATENKILGDDKNRLDYQLIGSGKAFIFLDGKVVEATWSKSGRDERTKFFDTKGQEIKFNRGKFWISILPDRNLENLKFSSAAQSQSN